MKGEKALEEVKIPDYWLDEDIRKETNTEKLETEKLSKSFFPLASTTASSDLKNSINSNKCQQLKKSQIPKCSNPIKNQLPKTEETSLLIDVFGVLAPLYISRRIICQEGKLDFEL